jgi:hypothetical protein
VRRPTVGAHGGGREVSAAGLDTCGRKRSGGGFGHCCRAAREARQGEWPGRRGGAARTWVRRCWDDAFMTRHGCMAVTRIRLADERARRRQVGPRGSDFLN